jgi:hypothetical protein
MEENNTAIFLSAKLMIYWIKCPSHEKVPKGKVETNKKSHKEKLLLKKKIKYLPHQLYRLITSSGEISCFREKPLENG